jgi:hypothetical protein
MDNYPFLESIVQVWSYTRYIPLHTEMMVSDDEHTTRAPRDKRLPTHQGIEKSEYCDCGFGDGEVYTIITHHIHIQSRHSKFCFNLNS